MFTSMDVYYAASSIGHECQLIAGEHGQDVLQTLMPEIVSMLEYLEACALYFEKENSEISRLRELVDALRVDCRAQVELKDKFNMSLEHLERSWYSETQHLLEQVTALEEENNRLAQELVSEVSTTDLNPASPVPTKLTVASILQDAAAGRPVNMPQSATYVSKAGHRRASSAEQKAIAAVLSMTEERLQLSEQENRAADFQLIGRLKECASSNYKEIRALNRDLLHLGLSLDATEEEVCRLSRQSGQLTVYRTPVRHQASVLLAEKASLESRLATKEQELTQLQQTLAANADSFANDLLAVSKVESKTSLATYETSLSSAWTRSRARSCPAHQALFAPSMSSANIGDLPCSSSDKDGIASLEELRHLLCERNELRCRLIELAEELDMLEKEKFKDPDVQGPLPREPIDKLRPGWSERPTIKLIFRKLLNRLTDTPSDTE